MLGIILLVGCATGALWPVHSFLVDFSAGFVETLCLILILATLVWGVCAFYILAAQRLRASSRGR
jgi:hypothetical protein